MEPKNGETARRGTTRTSETNGFLRVSNPGVGCCHKPFVRTFTRLEQKKQPGSGNAAWISCSLHFESKAEAHPLNPYQKLKVEGNLTKNKKILN